MTAKKIFKFIGIFIAIIIGLGLLLVGLVWGSFEWNRYSKKKEAAKLQKEVCDTITTVEGNFPIKVSDFTAKELKRIDFYLQRDKIIIEESVVDTITKVGTYATDVILPFKSLHVKDTIIVVIAGRTFTLSGFSYTAGYNYGMFGPVGKCECRGGSHENVNGEAVYSGWLVKKYGLVNYQLPPK